MPSRTRRPSSRYLYLFGSILCAVLSGCAAPTRINTTPSLEAARKHAHSLKPPDCAKAFKPYCGKNGFRNCPATIPNPHLYGDTLLDWNPCEAKINAYVEAQADLYVAEIEAAPACIRDVVISESKWQKAGLNPELRNDRGAIALARGVFLSEYLHYPECAARMCQWSKENRPAEPSSPYCVAKDLPNEPEEASVASSVSSEQVHR